jgi:hypothetical protein
LLSAWNDVANYLSPVELKNPESTGVGCRDQLMCLFWKRYCAADVMHSVYLLILAVYDVAPV